MEYESVQKLIEDNKQKINFGQFGHGTSDDWIDKAQTRLGVQFPPTYIWWLKNYKGGTINGDEIFSVYELDFDSVVGGDIVYINELERKNGFFTTSQLVIQHNDQAEDYYFDLNQMDDAGEYPVYVDPAGIKYADNFLLFLQKKIVE